MLRWILASTVLLFAGALAPCPARAATEVELLTMGPGDDVYARFGHSALRVRSDDGSDIVYNFGYTRFTPALIWHFLRGTAIFWVKPLPFGLTLRSYVWDDRSVYRQRLALSPAQHAELAALLRDKALPEHRDYLYHHFRNNCATKPRDLLDRVTGGEVRRQLGARDSGLRLRPLVDEGFAGMPGLLVLGDLLLGRMLDRELTVWEACFLPRELMTALTTVKGPSGRALAGPPEPLFLRREPSPLAQDAHAGERWLWRAALLILLLSAALAVLARARPHSRLRGGLLLALALPLGLAGLLVWALVAVTAVPELRWNENVLVLWPTDLALIVVALRWLRGRAGGGTALRVYAALRAAVPLGALIGHAAGWLVQQPLAFVLMSVSFGSGLLLACVVRGRTVLR